MISFSLRNCAIIAALLASASASNEPSGAVARNDLDIAEAARLYKIEERKLKRTRNSKPVKTIPHAKTHLEHKSRNSKPVKTIPHAKTHLKHTSRNSKPVKTIPHTKKHFEQTSRIVGGNQAFQGEYPYLVEWERGCGASLIHDDIVLTAAHCGGNDIPAGVIVSAFQTGKVNNGAQARSVVQHVPHPNYNSQDQENDFMIMRLNSPVSGVSPIALNGDPQMPSDGDVLTVMGFGDLADGGNDYPEFLQEVTVPYVPHAKCNQQYGGEIDEDVMMCAGYDQGGKDSCQGDSGGPIVKIVNGVHTQVGIVSWGYGCAVAGSPGVYSRISGQISWIQSEVCRLTKTEIKPDYCDGNNNPPPPTPVSGPSSPTLSPAPISSSPVSSSPVS